ncbi:MAG: hypothetical protein K0S57_180 [Ramlibacter sp.]|jgi:uncharacterized membrane protein|nr:hypothetical protein [Ramlibacter sp.]
MAARTWLRLSSSFWFVPSVIVLAAMGLAVALIELSAWQSTDLSKWSPRLFGAGADGSRAMLSAIATSMATVAGVVFSITMVTLSLSSTQYSPRVLRNFMRDRPTQAVLGVFVGIFAYCLVVLRTIRGGDEGGFIPSLAVLGGLGLAFAGIGVLIFFIHHVAVSIQASTILHNIGQDTAEAIDRLFPEELGAPAPPDVGEVELPGRWHPVAASRNGYVASIDTDALLMAACESDRVIRLRVSAGAYLSEGDVLLEVGGEEPPSGAVCSRLRGCIDMARQRTVEQDPGYGLQQLVDVALRALSPGINDPTTATMCVDQIGSLLARLARRRLPDPHRFQDGRLRVIAPAPDFRVMCELALLPVVRHARLDLQVIGRVLDAVEAIAAAACTGDRRRGLDRIARDLHAELAQVRPRRRSREAVKRLRALEAARLPAAMP